MAPTKRQSDSAVGANDLRSRQLSPAGKIQTDLVPGPDGIFLSRRGLEILQNPGRIQAQFRITLILIAWGSLLSVQGLRAQEQ